MRNDHRRPRRRLRVMAVVLTPPLTALWAVKLVRLQRSVDHNAQYWSRPQGDPGGLLYVALGDSAAQSIGASRPERGYVALLAQRLRDSTHGPVQVVNLSRSGARLRDVLDTQLPALQALERPPDVVTVAIGGNDIAAYDPALFAAQSEQLADALPDRAYVADAPCFMHGRWERDSRAAGDLLAAAAARRGLRPVALHEAQQGRGWRAMLTDFAADWFHPNDRGHRVWADAFWTQLASDAQLLRVPSGEAPPTVGADDDASLGHGDVQGGHPVAGVDRDGLR